MRQPSPFLPLSLIEIQQLAVSSRALHLDRLVYILLALHADCQGDVCGRVEDVARAAGLNTDRARNALRRLIRAGLVQRKRIGRRYSLNVWHIVAVRDAA